MKLPRKLVAALAAASFLLASPADASVAYPLASIYTETGFNLNPGQATTLTWSNPNNCANGAGGYNWYAVAAAGQQYYHPTWGQTMSAIYNKAGWCNRVWLKSGPWKGASYDNYLYTTCLKYGTGISVFGFPYNDNVKQVGLSYDPACPR